MNYTLASILGVGSGLTEPKDWPPLFGDITNVTTVRYFWGSYWQQLLRRMFSGWGEGLANFFNLPPHTSISTYFKLYVAFAISAFFHAIMTYTMPATKDHTFNDRFGLVFNGFMFQAFGVHLEDIILWAYRKVVREPPREKDDKRPLRSALWKRLLGRAWVTGWMWFSIYWAAEGYLRSGITLTSDVPMPIVEKGWMAFKQNGLVNPFLG
ncbi:hypothetical protein AJ79_03776 [Helicocarpus griseus UAMH5409]|uniref:Wax synthase domain-containing protein n=1 Tax=Helicocarpus griseus UAMH5409 TaxID=1447875 RepID=A0A2B7XXC6_9EURO|nr:hypothetical protein AJ79_03776 [Helicocarpus griseus UAMH5409]